MVDRIIAIREIEKLNQEDFAKKIGVSRNFVSLVETGKRNLSDRTIADICRTFNINETWLRTGKGEMFVQLTRSQEIMEFIGKILKSDDNNFKQRFVGILAQLEEPEWELIEKVAVKLVVGDNKKTEPKSGPA